MLAQIEDGILALIRNAAAAAPGLGYKIPSIESYGGELDDLEMLGQAVRKMPAVWVAFAGAGRPAAMGTQKDKWLVPLTFAVMVGARNVRGERFTRRGVTVAGQVREVGVYQLLEDMQLLLMRQDFGLAIDPLVPGTVKTLFNTRLDKEAFAIFAQEWHTKMVLAQPRKPLDPSDPMWLRLGITYYLQPDDGIADASDTVTLK